MFTDKKHYEIEIRFKCWMEGKEMEEIQTKVQELTNKLQETAGEFYVGDHLKAFLSYENVNITEDNRGY